MNNPQKTSANKSRKSSKNQKKLMKQSSSPLISGVQFRSDIYQNLTYVQRKPPLPESQKLMPNIKQKKQMLIKKSKKVPMNLNPKVCNLSRKQFVLSQPFLQQLLNKSKIQPMQKQKRHFGIMYDSHVLDNCLQQKQNPRRSLNLSKQRKLREDFSHHSDLSGNIPSGFKEKTFESRKKLNYRLNMQKRSNQLGISYTRPTMRKPCLSRTFSSIQIS